MTLEKMKMAEGTNIEEMLVEYVDKCNVLSETNAKLEVDNKIINTMCSELKNEKNLVEIELEVMGSSWEFINFQITFTKESAATSDSLVVSVLVLFNRSREVPSDSLFVIKRQRINEFQDVLGDIICRKKLHDVLKGIQSTDGIFGGFLKDFGIGN